MNGKILIICFFVLCACSAAFAQSPYTIFDDKMLLEGYAKKFAEEPKDILLAMIQDETLTSYKVAAAVRIFKERYASQVVPPEKALIEKILLRRLGRTNSPFIEIETMHALCVVDRYKYFNSMIVDLIKNLDHYNKTINEMAHDSIMDIIKRGHDRPREARIVFNMLRKMFFLSRKKLENTKEPGPKLKQKLDILRWSIKILGTQELKRLPQEVIKFL